MKSIFLTLVFFSLTVLADMPPQQWITWPPNGTTYLVRANCPGECYPLAESDGTIKDAEVLNLVGGVLIEDVGKKTEKLSRLETARLAEVQRLQDRTNAKNIDTSKITSLQDAIDAIKLIQKAVQ